MPKTIVKVFFNNGCTSLIYNDSTTAAVNTLDINFESYIDEQKL